MAVKLIANYSKRLGLPGYSSHQFSISVETELRDITEADAESQRLYQMLQQNVDSQIQEKPGFVPSEAYGNSPTPQNKPQPINSEPDGWHCSDKQQGFIQRLMTENKLQMAEVDSLAHRRFGRSLNRLDRKQASGLIDAMLDQYGSTDKGRRS